MTAVNQASITWGRGATSAKASVERLADTAANRARLQAEAAKDRLPSVVVKQGGDVLLLSGGALQTASRLATVQGPSIGTGDTLTVNGVDGTVLSEDDGFNEVDTQGVVVAVIDTGLDVNHPDFAGRVVSPYNVLTGTSDVTDTEGHGTHVAGIIAGAWGNKAGGVDPNAKIMPIKAAGKNGGFKASDVATGIRYAVDHGAKVINLSLGGPIKMPYVQEAINYAESKGVVVVAAMGNNGKEKATYPAEFTDVEAVASSKGDKRSKFSNYGDRTDVSAPGENILSTLPGGQYGTKSGTSMASPYVAGEAALVVAEHPDWTPAQVRQQLNRGVNTMSDAGWTRDFGYGEANLFKAVYGKDLPAIAKAPQAVKPESFWEKLLAFFRL